MEFKEKVFNSAKKNQLISLIRKLGKLVNEEQEFLDEYEKDVVENCKGEFDKAIICFKDLIRIEESKK